MGQYVQFKVQKCIVGLYIIKENRDPVLTLLQAESGADLKKT